MRWREDDGKLVVVLAIGDVLHDSFEALAGEAGMKGFAISGIGAVDQVELGRYRLDERRYEARRLEGVFELVSLLGNVSLRDGRPFAHLHACVAGPDLRSFGGHLIAASCAVTVEAIVTPLATTLTRGPEDEACGLRLLQLE